MPTPARMTRTGAIAFSSEVDSGSRKEIASKGTQRLRSDEISSSGAARGGRSDTAPGHNAAHRRGAARSRSGSSYAARDNSSRADATDDSSGAGDSRRPGAQFPHRSEAAPSCPDRYRSGPG